METLLRICSWREAPETAAGPDRRAGKRELIRDDIAGGIPSVGDSVLLKGWLAVIKIDKFELASQTTTKSSLKNKLNNTLIRSDTTEAFDARCLGLRLRLQPFEATYSSATSAALRTNFGFSTLPDYNFSKSVVIPIG